MKIGLTIVEEKVYFEFLQVAVGNRKSLSVSVTDADWHRLFEVCKRQALVQFSSPLFMQRLLIPASITAMPLLILILSVTLHMVQNR